MTWVEPMSDSTQEKSLPDATDAEADAAGERPTRQAHAVSVPQAAAEILAGAAAGAAVGSIAGPPGAVAGAVIGTLLGTVAEVVLEREQERAAQDDAELDADIGVIGGHIGEARPDAPPPRIGAFSAASMGASTHEAEDSDGPIQNVDGD